MSDAQDVEAIKAYLKNAQAQAAAFVDTCWALDAATKDTWYQMAPRIVAFVSAEGGDLAVARALRDQFNAYVALVSTLGCGDLASKIASAPPPRQAPPPHGTPNPIFASLDSLGELLPWLLLAFIVAEVKGARR